MDALFVVLIAVCGAATAILVNACERLRRKQ